MTRPDTFDVPAMLRDLQTLVELESPSDDLDAVMRVQDHVDAWMRDLGADVHTLPGSTRRYTLGPQDRPVLILMHADTVWPHGTLGRLPFRIEDDRAYGPGTYDMKGGIVMAVHALRAVRGQLPHGIEVLLTPDEETGSASSRAHIEDAAGHARAVLVVEPPVADTHALKTGRKGVGDYTLHLHGVASHAGNQPKLGASAVAEAARLILQVNDLGNDDLGTTVNATVIRGGTARNVIPADATVDIDVRVQRMSEAERVHAALHNLKTTDPRVTLSVAGDINRPPFERTDGTARLYSRAQAAARDLGFEVSEAFVGGGSDGNFTAPIAPTLDGLGAPGDGAHADHEHVRIDRLALHTALLARLILDPGVESA
nr:M20 family metallopeptidase [Deinococcus maricopensis]